MAIKKYVLRPEQQLTEEQILMVKAAAKRSLAQDEDNPEFTDEQLASLRRVHESRRVDRRRQKVLCGLLHRQFRKQRLWEKDTVEY